MDIPIKLHHPSAQMPSYAHPGDAGLDLCSTGEFNLAPFERTLIPTGLSLAIPEGYAGLLLPRSGLAINKGFSLVNSPGLIDSNYRGEIKLIAINLDPNDTVDIHVGDRVAQLLILKADEVNFILCDRLDDTSRGSGGFGSSGH